MNQPVLQTIDTVLDDAVRWSADHQAADGYWVGRLQSNMCMEAQWLLALHVIGYDDHPLTPKLARAILNEQREDGSWEVYKNATAGDINTTVECYAALRCAGFSADHEALVRAHGWIMARGGLSQIRVFTRYWLALIGEWPWQHTPNIPPEVIFFPDWFTFSIYNFSSWARATLVPIAVLSAARFSRPLPAERRLDALFPNGREAHDYSYPKQPPFLSLDNFFLKADRLLHMAQSMGLGIARKTAIKRCLEWILYHQDADGVWGGIQPPWIYSIMALHAHGYAHDHPVMAKALGALKDPRWSYDRDGGTYVQASVSPVWDTVLTLLALADAERTDAVRERVDQAIDWLLAREVRTPGDWCVKVKGVEPGGWAFEYENARYPDVDDTAVAVLVLAPYRQDPKWQARGLPQALDRAIAWMRAMQCKNGGWAAFDKDNDKKILCAIPFCDFGEALDPPSIDVTAHALEAFAAMGYGAEDPTVARGLAYLKSEQEADGSWWGRWGVNYIYGTAAALPALRALGQDMRDPALLKAAAYLRARQNVDGGWGESCASYMDPSVSGRGPSTASQTAWAIMALVALGRPEDKDMVERGVRFLAERQQDGSWDEPDYTGTGFPGYGIGRHIDLRRRGLDQDLQQSTELSRAFMINYNLYRHYFPMMALGRARSYLARRDNIAAAA